MWYIDCFSWAALGGEVFPVASYKNEKIEPLVRVAMNKDL